MEGLLIKRERIAQNISQQALCEGICTPSYLSKIENGTARCSEEMYTLLFDALNIRYVTDGDLLARFDDAFQEYYGMRMRCGTIEPGDAAALRGLCGKLRYSPRGTAAALVEYLLRNEPITREDMDSLSCLRPAFGKRESMLFVLVRVRHYSETRQRRESIACLEAAKGAGEPVVYWELCHDYFSVGAYRQSIEHGEEAYRQYATHGEVGAMMSIAMLIAAAYSNAMDYAGMRLWHKVCRNINQFLRDDEAAWLQYYNEGASLLMYGEYEKGLRCLLEGEPLVKRFRDRDESLGDLHYQKLALAWIFVGNSENAERALASIRQPQAEKSIETSIVLMRYMLATPDYARQKQYCDLLENCLLAAGQEARGRMEFFGCFLLGAYKATRQYKKAIQLMEKYKISHLFANNGGVLKDFED